MSRASSSSSRTRARSERGAAARRAVIYTRISHDPMGSEAGVDRQEKDCRVFAKKHGFTVVGKPVVDNDRSASRYSRRAREGWMEVLALVDMDAVDAIIAYDLDRLLRQPRELEDLIDRAERGLEVFSMSGSLDLATGDGRALARILVTMAAKESDNTSRRKRRQEEDDAAAGKKHGATPFGYRLVGATSVRRVVKGEERVVRVGGRWEPDPKTAPVLVDVAQRLLAGESATGLARELDRRRVPMANGGKAWTASTVRSVVTNAAVAGLRVHRGELFDGEWEPILDRPTWEQVRALFGARAGRGRHAKRLSLLTGLVRCECGATMVRDSSNGRAVLRCKPGPGRDGCGHNTVDADALEALTVEMLMIRLDSPALARQLKRGRRGVADNAERTLVDVQGRLDELARLYAGSEITAGEWAAARGPLRARLKAAQAELVQGRKVNAASGYLGRGGVLRAEWPERTLDQQRAILAAVLDQVTIAKTTKRGTALDPQRVTPVWLV